MHKNTKLLFEKFAKPYFHPGARILEIGPNAIPSDFQAMFPKEDFVWDTLDLDRGFSRPLTYVTTDEYRFPIPDGTYDLILTSSVIEHVRKIWRWMPELARVVRPGGVVVTISPISWEYHEDPVDCWRIYPDGMRALCDDAGLQTEVCEWDALSIANLRKIGGSVELWQKLSGILNLLHWKLGFPWEAAFDLITISRKPN
jgi:SAM-dependent methyltransferase